MGVSYSEFKHLNPYKLSLIAKGYEMQRKIRDQEAWMWIGSYMRDAISIGSRNGIWGKGKLEYQKKPLLSEQDNRKTDLKKAREAFAAGLLTMQANFELNHPKTDEKE